MRVIFMGTPDFAVPTLRAIAAAGHEIAAAYSQPPRPAGRGKKLQPSAVHLAAEEMGIEVRTPSSFKPQEERDSFAALNADVAVVAAYGLLLPVPVLEAPKHGCLNVHGSILPRWRGAAPVQRAILAGDATTGVTIMQMEKGLDTGPMLLKRTTRIDEKNAGELTDEIATMGAEAMVEVLSRLPHVRAEAQPIEGVTYAHKIDKAEARIDFAKGAEFIERQVRAFAPRPGAFFELEGERIRVLAADVIGRSGATATTLDDELTIACGFGAIRPTLVQRAGKPAMETAAMLRGYPIPAGTEIR
ncbi:methionyl-tRNA formyltransferase [Croceicoccus ponticola]|uniref:Methionyl-tRNA formyltransferase n=1 Tax=Croceicoccus ponticola TaxID=2217664 RepID=A0A437GVN0_9SPHN|nr:methionyl-tRNA formyltransferase [Croceicoccus ponticola]RVQ65958.1 methionyl-tRNA formyltransferase [Croceicoccus ponticola]